MRKVIVGVYVVHLPNPLSAHFVNFSFFAFTRSASIDGAITSAWWEWRL